jgi:hypothetical protein
MNYLAIVNKVLIRLREPEVSSVQDNPYSKLIGEFVNVVKREVEDSYNWAALRNTITATTLADVPNYILNGINTRSRILDVWNDSLDSELYYQTTHWFNRAYQGDPGAPNIPQYYNLNGVDVNGNQFLDLYPIPDGEYVIRFNFVAPQNDLVADIDELLIPYQLVIEGALSRAISERGDDGGYTEQEGRYARIVSDYIAIEAGGRPDETLWYAV